MVTSHHDDRIWPFGWASPYLATLAAHDTDFASRLFHMPRAELHFLGLTLALMGEARDDADHFSAFARSYGVLDRRTFFAAMAPDADNGVVKLVPKLAGSIWRPATYMRLAALFAEPEARKALRHMNSVSRRRVIYLSRLPAGYRNAAALDLVRRKGDLRELLFAIDVVRLVRADLSDREIVATLNKAGKKGKSRSIRDWVMKNYRHAAFPEAPVPAICVDGREVLRPLASYDDVARAAREFKNCIRTYLLDILKGGAFFYRYAPIVDGAEKPVAIVELRRMPVIGWVVHEALGPDNDAISSRDRAAILAHFRDAGISAAPQAIDPNVWFELS